jgi:hypothetical protein
MKELYGFIGFWWLVDYLKLPIIGGGYLDIRAENPCGNAKLRMVRMLAIHCDFQPHFGVEEKLGGGSLVKTSVDVSALWFLAIQLCGLPSRPALKGNALCDSKGGP